MVPLPVPALAKAKSESLAGCRLKVAVQFLLALM